MEDSIINVLSNPGFTIATIVVALTVWRAARYLAVYNGIIQRGRVQQMEIRPGGPADMLNLDGAALDAATCEMQALGFEWLEDHLSRTYHGTPAASPWQAPPIPDPNASPAPAPARFVPQGFARVFVHRGHGCLGKVIFVAVRDTTGVRPVKTTFVVGINSYSGPGDDDWTYTTTNRTSGATANAIMKLWRRPRRLTTRLPDAPPAQLLEFHLRRRDEIAHVAGITWMRSLSIDDDLRSETRSSANMRAVFATLTPLKMAWELFRLKHESHQRDAEWLGELEGKLRA